MSFTGDPVALVLGTPATLKPPQSAPGGIVAVQLDNHSPWLVKVSTGLLETWLSPWTSGLYPTAVSGGAVTLTPQQLPGAPATGGVSASVAPTWYSTTDTAPGTFPAVLPNQLTLSGGKQDQVMNENTFFFAGAFHFRVDLKPVDRSLLFIVNPSRVRTIGNLATACELDITVSGADSGVHFGTQTMDLWDPTIGTHPPTPAVQLPSYGGADTAANVTLQFSALSTPTLGAFDNGNGVFTILSMPDPILLGSPLQPLMTTPGDAATRGVRFSVPAGTSVAPLFTVANPVPEAHAILRTLIVRGTGAGTGVCTLDDGGGNAIWESTLAAGQQLAPVDLRAWVTSNRFPSLMFANPVGGPTTAEVLLTWATTPYNGTL